MTTELLGLLRNSMPSARAEVMRFAETAGVPPDTALKIRSGETRNPRISTVEKLLRAAGIDLVIATRGAEATTGECREPEQVASAISDEDDPRLRIPQRKEVARIVGSSDAYLWQLETGRRRASRWLAEAIERATDGAVTCWQLRPDLFEAPGAANDVVTGALDGVGVVSGEK